MQTSPETLFRVLRKLPAAHCFAPLSFVLHHYSSQVFSCIYEVKSEIYKFV